MLPLGGASVDLPSKCSAAIRQLHARPLILEGVTGAQVDQMPTVYCAVQHWTCLPGLRSSNFGIRLEMPACWQLIREWNLNYVLLSRSSLMHVKAVVVYLFHFGCHLCPPPHSKCCSELGLPTLTEPQLSCHCGSASWHLCRPPLRPLVLNRPPARL